MEERLLSSNDVLKITGIKSRSTLWKKSRDHTDSFPMPFTDGSKFTRWKQSDIQNWIENLSTA